MRPDSVPESEPLSPHRDLTIHGLTCHTGACNVTIFVTGGTGLLGVNLIRTLVARGERVRALVRPCSSLVGLENLDVEFIEGDVRDRNSILAGMRGCDQVYHAAGRVQVGPWNAKAAQDVNVRGTENVCKAALETGVGRLVHTSSVAAIGAGTMARPATEESLWNLGYLRSPYYHTKHEAEHVVLRYVHQGINAVIVNPSYMIGPWDVKPSSGRMMLLIAAGRVQFCPEHGGIGFVDVREAVDGMCRAMERGRCGDRYILSNENMTYYDFGKAVAEVARVAPPKRKLPYWLLYGPACAGSVLGRISPERFADYNLTMLRIGFCEHYVSAEKARRELSVAPRPIKGAISDGLDWFEEHGYFERANGGWKCCSEAMQNR